MAVTGAARAACVLAVLCSFAFDNAVGARARSCAASGLDGYSCTKTLTDGMHVHWALVGGGERVRLAVDAPGTGWVAIGFGTQMVGSEVVVAKEDGTTPRAYQIKAKRADAIEPLATAAAPWLLSTSLTRGAGSTRLEMERRLTGGVLEWHNTAEHYHVIAAYHPSNDDLTRKHIFERHFVLDLTTVPIDGGDTDAGGGSVNMTASRPTDVPDAGWACAGNCANESYASLAAFAARARELDRQSMTALYDAGTLWVLLMALFGFFLQTSTAFLLCGGARAGNVMSCLYYLTTNIGVTTLTWWLFGYAAAFGEAGVFAGLADDLYYIVGEVGFIDAEADITGEEYRRVKNFFYSLNVALLVLSLFSSTLFGRVTMMKYTWLCFCISTFVFPFAAHWVWSPYGMLSPFAPPGERIGAGYLDIHGVGLLSVFCGSASLTANIMLNMMNAHTNTRGSAHGAHNRFLQGNGVMLLVFAWFGLIGGNIAVPRSAAVDTDIAAASYIFAVVGTGASTVTGVLIGLLYLKHLDFETTIQGGLTGLVASSCCAGVVSPAFAPLIGVSACIALFIAVAKCRTALVWYDQELLLSFVIYVSGILGTLVCPLLHSEDMVVTVLGLARASSEIRGAWQEDVDSTVHEPARGSLFGTHILAVLLLSAWGAGCTALLIYIPSVLFSKKYALTLRFRERRYLTMGLDLHQHGGYFGDYMLESDEEDEEEIPGEDARPQARRISAAAGGKSDRHAGGQSGNPGAPRKSGVRRRRTRVGDASDSIAGSSAAGSRLMASSVATGKTGKPMKNDPMGGRSMATSVRTGTAGESKLASAVASTSILQTLRGGDTQGKLTAWGLVAWVALIVAFSIYAPVYHSTSPVPVPDYVFTWLPATFGAGAFEDYEANPLSVWQAISDHLDTIAAREEYANSAANTMWMLFAGICVFLMQTGFCFLEAGGVRSGSVINIILKNLCDCGIGAFMWWLCGYAIAYGELGNYLIGGQGSLFMLSPGYESDSPAAHFYLSFVYMTTAATIVSGAVAERIQCTAYCAFVVAVSGFGYPLCVRWIWSSYGWLSPFSPNRVLANGCLDFAGSAVIHLFGGTCAFVFAYLLGPRKIPGGHSVFSEIGQRIVAPHNKLEMAVGTTLLWFSWFGFNGGSVAGLDGDKHLAGTNAVITTLIASSTSCLVGAAYFRWEQGCFEITGTCNAALAGLVAITAGCAYMSPVYAPVVGAVSVVMYVAFVKIRTAVGIDDVVDAGAVHFANGAWGTLAAGLFADTRRIQLGTGDDTLGESDYGAAVGGGGNQFAMQLLTVTAVIAWAVAFTVIVYFTIDKVIGCRVHLIVEMQGLDGFEHHARAYDYLDAFEAERVAMETALSTLTDVMKGLRNLNIKYAKLALWDMTQVNSKTIEAIMQTPKEGGPGGCRVAQIAESTAVSMLDRGTVAATSKGAKYRTEEKDTGSSRVSRGKSRAPVLAPQAPRHPTDVFAVPHGVVSRIDGEVPLHLGKYLRVFSLPMTELMDNLNAYHSYLPHTALAASQASSCYRTRDPTFTQTPRLPVSPDTPLRGNDAFSFEQAANGAGGSGRAGSLTPVTAFANTSRVGVAVVSIHDYGILWDELAVDVMSRVAEIYRALVRHCAARCEGYLQHIVDDKAVIAFQSRKHALDFGFMLQMSAYAEKAWPHDLALHLSSGRETGFNGPRLKIGVAFSDVDKKHTAFDSFLQYEGAAVETATEMAEAAPPGAITSNMGFCDAVKVQLQHEPTYQPVALQLSVAMRSHGNSGVLTGDGNVEYKDVAVYFPRKLAARRFGLRRAQVLVGNVSCHDDDVDSNDAFSEYSFDEADDLYNPKPEAKDMPLVMRNCTVSCIRVAAATCSAETASALVSSMLPLMEEAAGRTDGEILHVASSTVVCVHGYTKACSDHNGAAMRFAQIIQTAAAAAVTPPHLSFHVGVASGRCFKADLGTAYMRLVTLLGPSMEIARVLSEQAERIGVYALTLPTSTSPFVAQSPLLWGFYLERIADTARTTADALVAAVPGLAGKYQGPGANSENPERLIDAFGVYQIFFNAAPSSE